MAHEEDKNMASMSLDTIKKKKNDHSAEEGREVIWKIPSHNIRSYKPNVEKIFTIS